MSAKDDNHRPVPAVAVFLAWLIPGAGHIYLGRVARGVVILATITALFWTGVAIGGVLTVDYYYERWWFIAEMFTGVHGLVGWYRQDRVYDRLAMDPEVRGEIRPVPGGQVSVQQYYVDRQLAEEGIALVAPADTVARAYAGVAGLLNLMCIFDALLLGILGVRGEAPPPGTRQAAEEGEGSE